MVVIIEGGLGGSAGTARGPIDSRDGDVGSGRRKQGRAGGGSVGGRDGSPVGRHGNGGAGSHVDAKCYFAVIHQGRHGGVIHL